MNKKRAWQKGYRGEKLCAFYLRVKGYKILAHRYRTPWGEIDIIAQKQKTLIFIEIKTRKDYQSGVESLQPKQQQRIQDAALYYLSHFPRRNDSYLPACRFDVLICQRFLRITHLKNAWQVTGQPFRF